MDFKLTVNCRNVLAGCAKPEQKDAGAVRLRLAPSEQAAQVATAEAGEAVVVVELEPLPAGAGTTPTTGSENGRWAFIRRNDGVQGYAPLRDLHLQRWPRFVLRAASAISARWRGEHYRWMRHRSSNRVGSIWTVTDSGYYAGDALGVKGKEAQPIIVMTPDAFVQSVTGRNPFTRLFLFDPVSCRAVICDSLHPTEPLLAEPTAAVAGDIVSAPSLHAAWLGQVFTFTEHFDPERVGEQWIVSHEGFRPARLASFGGALSETIPITVLTPLAWVDNHSKHVYCLEMDLGLVVLWSAKHILELADWRPLATAHRTSTLPASFALRLNGQALCSNVRGDVGATLLRKNPHPSKDDNLTGQQVANGDAVVVISEVAGGDWAEVRKRDGSSGWIRAENLHCQAHGGALIPGLFLGIHVPPEWDTQETNLVLVPMEPGSAEWRHVAARLTSHVHAEVVSIERVQNALLWQQYSFQRHQMQAWRCGIAPREEELWHGTGSTSALSIYDGQDGFDMRFCQKGMWGVASYFAEQADYSDHYAHKVTGNALELLLAQVLVGDTIELSPDSTLRMPPAKPAGHAAVHAAVLRYDSVTGVGGGGGSSRIFMIYANGRAYPKYRILYRKVAGGYPAGAGGAAAAALPPHTLSPPPSPGLKADKYSLYLIPVLQPTSLQWAGWLVSDTAQKRIGWGGLHVTLCTFSPKASSNLPGRHQASLARTAAAMISACQSQYPQGNKQWQLSKKWYQGKIMWCNSHNNIAIYLPAQSKTLQAICSVVASAGLIGARTVSTLHISLSTESELAPCGVPLPVAGHHPCPLPSQLLDDLCSMRWQLAIVKLAGGKMPIELKEHEDFKWGPAGP